MISEKISGLRRQAGWSQEELAERLDVSRQAVSKWESGASQPDIGRVVALSRLFGVSTDYLLTEDGDDTALVPTKISGDGRLEVDEDDPPPGAAEVYRYLGNRRRWAPSVGFGAALCVASPAPLLALLGISKTIRFIGEGLFTALGVGALLAMVAAAVAMFVTSGSQLSKFSAAVRRVLPVGEDMRRSLDLQRQEYRRQQAMSNAEGVFLCALSPAPAAVGGILDEGGLLTMLGTSMLLVMIAAGVFLFVRGGIIMGSYSHLLKGGKRAK